MFNDCNTHKHMSILKLLNPNYFQVSWSPDSKQLLSASGDKTCKVWDVETGDMVAEFPMGSELEDQQMSCIWVGNYLISVSLSGFINYLDLDNPNKPKKIIKVGKNGHYST